MSTCFTLFTKGSASSVSQLTIKKCLAYKGLVFGFLVAFSIAISHAASDHSALSLSDALHTINKTLAQIEAVQFSAESVTEITSDSVLKRMGPEGPDLAKVTTNIRMTYRGRNFWYDIEQKNATGKIRENLVSAFNGELYQQLSRESGILYLSKIRAKHDPIFSQQHYLLMPFYFVLSAKALNPFAPLDFQSFTNRDDWSSILEQVGLSGVENVSFGDQECWRVQLSAKNDKESTYIVYFSKKLNGYPIGWELRNKLGEILYSYTVNATASLKVSEPGGGNFYYPMEASLKGFSSNVLASVTNIRISDVTFEIKDDSEMFTIDPASATAIRDVDNNLLIEVPR